MSFPFWPAFHSQLSFEKRFNLKKGRVSNACYVYTCDNKFGSLKWETLVRRCQNNENIVLPNKFSKVFECENPPPNFLIHQSIPSTSNYSLALCAHSCVRAKISTQSTMLTSLYITLSFWVFLVVSFWVLKLALRIQSLYWSCEFLFWVILFFLSLEKKKKKKEKFCFPDGMYGIIMNCCPVKWHLSLFLNLRRVCFATSIPCQCTHLKSCFFFDTFCVSLPS